MSSSEKSPPPPPPPSSDDSSSSSPPPPSDDSSSSSSSPPPPSDGSSSSSSSPPPPSDGSSSSSSSPPPPSDDSSSSSPPPPSGDSSSSSPPPPSDDSSSSSPPPPSGDKNSSSGSDSGSPSPPPPSRSRDGNDGSSKSSKGDSPNQQLVTSPQSGSRSHHKSPAVKDSGDDSLKFIAGAAAGGAVLLLVIIVVVICAKRRKRKARARRSYYNNGDSRRKSYFNDSGPGWNNNGQNWNQNGHGHFQGQMMKFPPQSGQASTAASSEYGWAVAPPPPPPMMSSHEVGSAGFTNLPPLPPHSGMSSRGVGQGGFTHEDVATATNGFSQSNLLGQGGFGYVYKGILPNGREVAVKTLKANSGQGEREFQAEVDIISRVHHRHLVSLEGYCIAGSQRMLVYEFVPNGPLEFHLHAPDRRTLDWPTRLKIALGAAKGFAYLHEDCHPRIIHRDIKASNILLDMNFEAKVADFGLAKLSQDTNTHVSTRIMGTFGYLAPEYASSGKLTEKSDVYSFGVMLLELITGRRPIDMNNDDEDCLVDWAEPILNHVIEGGSFDELVDPKLGKNYNEQEMYHMICCAAASIRQSARKRPKMSQIVRVLEGDVSLDDLNPNQGGALMGSRTNSEYDLKSLAKGSGQLSSSPESLSSGEMQEGESRK